MASRAPALFFIHMPGCPACAKTAPAFRAATQKLRIRSAAVDLSRIDWKAKRWMPRVTPTMVLLLNGSMAGVLEGQHTAEQIEAWVRGLVRR